MVDPTRTAPWCASRCRGHDCGGHRGETHGRTGAASNGSLRWRHQVGGASVLVAAALLLSSQLALAQVTQQGAKLVGTGAVGLGVEEGYSVALSSDGNTAIVGGPDDNPGAGNNSGTGAAWVFTRSNGVWTQQGS